MSKESKLIAYPSILLIILNSLFYWVADQDTVFFINSLFTMAFLFFGLYASISYFAPMQEISEEAVITTIIFYICLLIIVPAGIEGHDGVSYIQYFVRHAINYN